MHYIYITFNFVIIYKLLINLENIFIFSAKINHRLTLFYLANDVVQNGKRKGFLQFGNSFAEVLREATLLVR